jgi:glutamate--cysteine ligase catalytic subunit
MLFGCFHPHSIVLIVCYSIGLPSINHIDADRVKCEGVKYQGKYSAAGMLNPLHPYAGPPRLHSNYHSLVANVMSGSFEDLLSRPESRKMSGDEKEPLQPTAWQVAALNT